MSDRGNNFYLISLNILITCLLGNVWGYYREKYVISINKLKCLHLHNFLHSKYWPLTFSKIQKSLLKQVNLFRQMLFFITVSTLSSGANCSNGLANKRFAMLANKAAAQTYAYKWTLKTCDWDSTSVETRVISIKFSADMFMFDVSEDQI